MPTTGVLPANTGHPCILSASIEVFPHTPQLDVV